jgi:CheY-like chemotaxis protein
VADSDPKNLQILKENLEVAGFRVATVSNGVQAWDLIRKAPPTIVLSEVNLPELDGLQLLERIQNDEQLAPIPLIFLTNKRELKDRVQSLKMGAKDYLVKPLHVKEVIAHIKMVIARIERQRSNETNSYFKIAGKLEELNVFDLIESFGIERKTGILTITNQQKLSGEIFFKDGCVINARQGDFKKEKAIFQMLPWTIGGFSMVFRDVTVPDEIAVSNLGLLLQGLKRMEQREKFMLQFPSKSVSFLPTSTFKNLLAKRKMSKEMVRFISLFDGKRTVNDILSFSVYDDLRTLELTVRLYKQGFIKPTNDVAAPTLKIPRPELDLPASSPVQIFETEDPRPSKIKEPIVRPVMTDAKAEPQLAEKIEILRKNGTHPTVPPRPEVQKSEFSPALRSEPVVPQPKKIEVPALKAASEKPLVEPVAREKIPEPTVYESQPSIRPRNKEAEAYPKPALDEEMIQTVVFKKREEPPAAAEPKPAKPAVTLKTGLVLFLGDPDDSAQSVFRTITNDTYKIRNFNNIGTGEIKHSRVKIAADYALNLISIPIKGRFDLLVEKYAETLTTFTLVVDCLNLKKLDYFGYLSRMFYEKYTVPFFITAINFRASELTSLDVLRDRMGVNQRIPAFDCEPTNRPAIRNILKEMIHDWPADQPIKVVEDELETVEFE